MHDIFEPLHSMVLECLLCLAIAPVGVGRQATPGAQQSPDPGQKPPDAAQQPAPQGQRPLNPTQEVAGQQPEGNALDVGPAKLRIGGYVGLTGLHRSTNSGGGTGTRFGAIPYEDELQGNVSETRLTAESSRLSFRVDAEFPDRSARFRSLAGYFEMDFSGTAPGNVEVSSTSAGFRLRNAFAEVKYRDSFFMSAGQAFSLMTPVKGHLSMWPADQDLSQALDTNYLAGLVWARLPQLRLTWRPSPTFDWAMSVENPEQQIAAGPVTLPSCCAGDIEAQYSTGSNNTGVPDLMPDIVTRVAINPGKAVHLGAGGVLRVFRHTAAPFTDTFRDVGGGVNIDAALRPTTKTRVLLQSAFGSGLGRYVGGLAPDVAFHRDGSVSSIRTTSWVAGIEQKVFSRASVAGYYSGIVIEDNFDRDVDGSFIGYGFPGSSNADNRKIHELTGTLSTLTMQTENRGSAQLGLQLSWLTREPWFRGSGPASASALLFFAQMRYNLP